MGAVRDGAGPRHHAPPRYGNHLLRRVANPTGGDPAAGWVVVARLTAQTPAPRPLPTVASWTGFCRGVGVDAHLAGDPADRRVAWLVSRDGTRRDVVWPPGTTARFNPDLEILDADGTVILRAGSPVSGGCTTGPDARGPLLVASGH